MSKMTSPWIAYAAPVGHSFFLEVTNNAATNKGVMYHFSGTVYTHAPHSEELSKYIGAVEFFSPYREEVIRKFVGACTFIEWQYPDIKLLKANEAWAERLKLPLPTIEGMWKNYLDRINDLFKKQGRSLNSIDPDERIEITEEWIVTWSMSDHKNKEQLMEFGKNKLYKLKQTKLE